MCREMLIICKCLHTDWGDRRTVSERRMYTRVNKVAEREFVPVAVPASMPEARVVAIEKPVVYGGYYDDDDDWDFVDESDVYLRSKFFESWWMEVDLPNEGDADG